MVKRLVSWGWVLLLPLVIWTFWPGFVELHQTYTSSWLFVNALAAGALIVAYGLFAYKQRRTVSSPYLPTWSILAGFVAICIGIVLNNVLGGFEIVPPILAYFAIYCMLGFLLLPKFWRRSLPIFLLLILTLPILERVQKFIGFPLRTLTAQIVSLMLQFVGAGHVTNSTVIMTENYATTIDLPCSGIKSLYFGGVILLAVYFMQEVKLSIKAILVALGFFGLLLLFNTWRVFSLVYIYGILQFKEAGDAIHVAMGILGFAISCIFLWYQSERLAKQKTEINKSAKRFEALTKKLPQLSTPKLVTICVVLLLATGLLTKTVLALPPAPPPALLQANTPFNLPNSAISVLPFSDSEETLFLHPDVTFATKYAVKWQGKQDLSLLLIKSTSARTHHDPELCLQGLGYEIIHQTTLPLNIQVNQVDVKNQTTRGSVYYWYISQDQTITDYSQRVWQNVQEPNKEWVLAEIAVLDSQKFTNGELEALVKEVTLTVKEQVL